MTKREAAKLILQYKGDCSDAMVICYNCPLEIKVCDYLFEEYPSAVDRPPMLIQRIKEITLYLAREWND